MKKPKKKKIEQETWGRRKQFELFSGFDFPHFSVTAPVDVTEFRNQVKKKGTSLFNAVLFAIMKTANNIPEFRTRFHGNNVYEYDKVDPSFTVPIANDHFAFCEVIYDKDWEIFNKACQQAKAAGKLQTELTDNTSTEDHWIYLSCTPWLNFSASQHPVASSADCIPRIAWGQITNSGDTFSMPVNIQVHHALIDGIHAAKFYQQLEENLGSF
jgi:chloramphenicol O-acetyltransferase type A